LIVKIGDYICTHSGVQFYPLDPEPGAIRIEDIAHALARISRFNGHTSGDYAYSVAQHSVVVSTLVGLTDPDQALVGLLHDAEEAYLGDIARPLKELPEYDEIRQCGERLRERIFRQFGLEPLLSAAVKAADQQALATEIRDFMPAKPVIWGKWLVDVEPMALQLTAWQPRFAEKMFLCHFSQLMGARGLAAEVPKFEMTLADVQAIFAVVTENAAVLAKENSAVRTGGLAPDGR
jgi:hypothetical protein